MRRLRLAQAMTLRDVAKRAGISPAYLCDLELGRRAWNTSIRVRVVKAVNPKTGRLAGP
jgi:transcriptional regulator with XRE-family HTH domain